MVGGGERNSSSVHVIWGAEAKTGQVLDLGKLESRSHAGQSPKQSKDWTAYSTSLIGTSMK